MTPEVQHIMLERLRLEFGVDVAPAEGLTGAALDTWIERAEDALFERLIADRQSALADKLRMGAIE
jgi:hypothetical protein